MSASKLLLISVCFIPSTQAQETDSLQAVAFYQLADSLQEARQLEAADDMASKAIVLNKKIKNWKGYVDGYRVILMNGYYGRKYQSAILRIKEGVEAIPPEASLAIARMDYFLGYAYSLSGDVFESLKYYEISAKYYREAKDSTSLMGVYSNLGNRYTQLGDYTKAIDFQRAVIPMAIKAGDTTKVLIPNYRNLGRSYFHKGDYRNAQQYYSKAQALHDPQDGYYEYLFARIQYRLKHKDEAFRLINKSIQLTKEKKGAVRKGLAEKEKLLGEIYLLEGDFQKALFYFEKVLPDYQNGPNVRELGKLHIFIGNAKKGLEEYDEGLKNYQLALNIFLTNFKDDNPLNNPTKKSWSREIWLMDIFRNKGYCFLGKYKKSGDEKWLELADKNYQLAIDFIQYIKTNFDELESAALLADYVHPFYEDLINTKLLLAKTQNTPSKRGTAFKIVQEANAFVLRDLLNEKQALEIAGIPQDTLDILAEIQRSKRKINRQIERSSTQKLDSLNEVLFQVKQNQITLKKEVEDKYPLYKRLRNDLQVTTIGQLQEKLDSSTLLLRYFLGNEILYTFSISQNSFDIDTVNLPHNFELIINQYRQSISDLDFIKDSTRIAEQQYLSAAHELYQLLLKKPLATFRGTEKIKRLKIIADGALNTIPFQALLMKKSDSWTDPEPLVISKYAVSYAYFCNMLLENKEERGYGDPGFVSFGLEFDDFTLKYLEKISKDSIVNQAIKYNLRSGTLTNLPFSDDEAREIAEIMDGKAWLNDQASKANFLAQAPQAGIIHMATHSIVDDEQGNLSALVFIKTKDSLNNLLRQADIYNLELDAEMIVLSACNTAFGPVQKGEGVNSLARAFNFSGIPSVVATFWSVTDESSKKMMLLFYQNLKKGLSKDEALRQAQLTYLENDQLSSPAFRSPVYWAAWKSIGDNSPLMRKERSVFSPTIFFGSMGLLLLFFLIYKKYR